MSGAGFTDIRRMAVGVSDDPHFTNIEKHGINLNNEPMNAFTI